MSLSPEYWTEQLESALAGYAPDLVRQIAARLLKTRNQWPVEELAERVRDAANNAPVIDRRLKDLPPACRKLLALIGVSRQPRWKTGHLLAMLAALGHSDGITPIQTLFEEGLLLPWRSANSPPLRNFQQWLAQEEPRGLQVFAHPLVTQRARQEDLGLPALPAAKARGDFREADGLEWPMRLAVVWQQVFGTPLRQTLQRDFFKRDLQRLRTDPLLTGPFADHLADVPDIGLLAVAWALQAGLLREHDAELHTAGFPAEWSEGLYPALAHLWRVLPRVETWDPARGWEPARVAGSPFPSVYLPALLLLARQPADAWVRVADVEEWLTTNHPYWNGVVGSGLDSWVAPLLSGVLFQLKLVQSAASAGGDPLTRLSPFGRWLAAGERLPDMPEYRQTLIAQANFEILTFRQGLTPALVADLTRFARWKSLGTACLLELAADDVYRGLETGLSFDAIRLLLQRHGMRHVPDNVIDALRTWANKRERVVVYSEAVLIEFASSADLDLALSRGLVEVRLSDRLGLVGNENSLDYRQFRLTGTRDYGAKAERCITVGDDGLTLQIDAARADLLLETELTRVAEADADRDDGRRAFRLTRESLHKAQQGGLSLPSLDEWLVQRAGEPLSASARFLAAPEGLATFSLQRCLVLHAPSETVADGLMQWPVTRALIADRLGPTALLVEEEQLTALRDTITRLGQIWAPAEE